MAAAQGRQALHPCLMELRARIRLQPLLRLVQVLLVWVHVRRVALLLLVILHVMLLWWLCPLLLGVLAVLRLLRIILLLLGVVVLRRILRLLLLGVLSAHAAVKRRCACIRARVKSMALT